MRSIREALIRFSPEWHARARLNGLRHHPGTVNVLLMDGSVRSINDTILLAVLATRAGAEIVPNGF